MANSFRAYSRSFTVATAVFVAMGAWKPSNLAAQEKPDSVVRVDTIARPARAMATRSELEALLAGKEGAVSDDLARQLKDRLEKGDLQPGDRVALRVVGEQTLTDTFAVTPERTLELPNMAPVPVNGVLRSELRPYLTKQLGKYIRNPDVQAAALVRVSVIGAVGKPGFYNLPADLLASDAIMAAGGPGGKADMNRTTIRRGAEEIVDEEQLASAVQSGESLDQLNVQSGDEIIVGERGEGARGVLRTMGMISGAIFGIVAITRIF
jgi:protein involved in polysaccharide export with SLBB domain